MCISVHRIILFLQKIHIGLFSSIINSYTNILTWKPSKLIYYIFMQCKLQSFMWGTKIQTVCANVQFTKLNRITEFRLFMWFQNKAINAMHFSSYRNVHHHFRIWIHSNTYMYISACVCVCLVYCTHYASVTERVKMFTRRTKS